MTPSKDSFRSEFPIFRERPRLIYLDSAATSQKPQVVLDAERNYYETFNSNIHRSAHFLAEEATIAYEETRLAAADFIGAHSKHEIVFTRNATESINLVARSFGDAFLDAGDEVLLTLMEHHSNIVPWLQLKERKGIQVNYIDVDPEGRLIFDESKITPRTKLVSISGMSNILGTIPNLKPIIEAAHKVGAKVLVDACQLAVHAPINVQELEADFVVMSAHKMYGPTGVGILYGKKELLDQMPPFMGGGEMIQEVFKDHFTAAEAPHKFEAGTPNIAGIVTMKAALNFLSERRDSFYSHEDELTNYALEKLKTLPYLRLIGPKDMEARGPIISFTMEGVHPHDIAEGLSQKQICIRAGHHCGQILMDRMNLPATARISLAPYNTKEDIDSAIHALEEVYLYFSS
ncbi:MAG: SufS family cysteine desulfurase [Candidatus Peregrinibacteria bacterium]|nr:SufS family cysteine desulfurase [Candidatus Peregrinibacteria bacterium]